MTAHNCLNFDGGRKYKGTTCHNSKGDLTKRHICGRGHFNRRLNQLESRKDVKLNHKRVFLQTIPLHNKHSTPAGATFCFRGI